MSLFAEEETLCQREHNSCKRKAKCKRHEDDRDNFKWIADYWNNFGRFCEHYIPVPKEKIIAKAGTKTTDDQGS